jgi:hypothetical protein
VQHASDSTRKPRGVFARDDAAAARLDPNQSDRSVIDKRVEDAE